MKTNGNGKLTLSTDAMVVMILNLLVWATVGSGLWWRVDNLEKNLFGTYNSKMEEMCHQLSVLERTTAGLEAQIAAITSDQRDELRRD